MDEIRFASDSGARTDLTGIIRLSAAAPRRPSLLLHGAGNGILTIARGTLPLAIFGPENYAYRLGLMGALSRIAQALAPLAFGLLLELLGRGIIVVSSALSLSALIALLLFRTLAGRRTSQPPPSNCYRRTVPSSK